MEDTHTHKTESNRPTDSETGEERADPSTKKTTQREENRNGRQLVDDTTRNIEKQRTGQQQQQPENGVERFDASDSKERPKLVYDDS